MGVQAATKRSNGKSSAKKPASTKKTPAKKTTAKKAAAKDSGAKNTAKKKTVSKKIVVKPVKEAAGNGGKPSSDNGNGNGSKRTTTPLQVAPVNNGPDPLRDDPVIDRRIIEGMLGDRKTLMSEMAELGYVPDMVMRRAAELGLSEALIRQVRGVAADLAGERPGGRRVSNTNLGARVCLSCDRVFLSTGRGNRLCMRCRGGDAGLALL